MVGAIVHQLTKNLTEEEVLKGGFADYFVDHTLGVYPQAASGTPFSASVLAVKGDTIADLVEDMAAEQKARTVYENILRFTDDPDVKDPIKFLRAREIVHFQRFGETKRTKGSPEECLKDDPPGFTLPISLFGPNYLSASAPADLRRQ